MQDWQFWHGQLMARLKRCGLSSRVLAACQSLARHRFAPGLPLEQAYLDHAMPIDQGQTISQPSLVAQMTDLLQLKGSERVLEIGTGSGYQTALLARLCAQVYTVERIPQLAHQARQRLTELGFENIHFRTGDGYAGWPEAAPFDRILLTAAPPEWPPALIEQLQEGGMILGPVGFQHEVQTLLCGIKRGEQLLVETCGEVIFVPMIQDL